MPRVVIDARLTRQMSVGMKAYSAELAARLPQLAPDIEFVPFTHGGNFGIGEQIVLPMLVRRSKAALTHYLSLYAPVLAPQPYVVTVHDLIHLRFPQYFKAKVAPYYETVVRRLLGRAARVITDDPRTVADLQHFLDVDPEKVRVIALGAADLFFAPILEPTMRPRPYLLYAGNHREHKDLATLFAAWSELPAEYPIDVCVTGADDLQGFRERFRRSNGDIVALGDLDNVALAQHYAGAAALVHPALCEGFGLPMLEAMAVGCPVVACQDAVPAVLRDGTLTFAPRDVSAARSAIEQLLHDAGLRRTIADKGHSRARAYTWDRCALETADVYREVLMGPSQR